jgi:deoxyribose-phosphate aldolase
MFIGAFLGGDLGAASEDIRAVAAVCARSNVVLKVILETCLLRSRDEKEVAVRLAIDAGCHYVKTSTGFSSGGAKVDDVALMASIAGPRGVGVKASGGVRTRAAALELVAAGATRIGASNLKALLLDTKSPEAVANVSAVLPAGPSLY